MGMEVRETGETGTIFAAVLDRLPKAGSAAWNLRLGVEAVLGTFTSLYVALWLNIPEAGLVAVALAAGALSPRVNTILAINRSRIWAEKGSGRKANLESTLSGICLFFGMFLVFLVIALITDTSGLREHFSFILKETQFDAGLTPERFSLGISVFQHNLIVLIAFVVLAFLYRSFGTMIALGWNASAWAITLVLLASVGVKEASSPTLYGLLVVVAILPHLVLEAVAYVVGALAAIFLSRGITLYGWMDPRLRRVLVAVVVLGVLSLVLLVVAGLVEINYAPRILRLL